MQPSSLILPDQLEKEAETVGSKAVELLSQGSSGQEVEETRQEAQKDYIDNLIEAAKRGEKQFPHRPFFYVCVQQRRERLLANVVRTLFYPRQTRPSPDYDLALYYYEPKSEKLSFVWCIPDKETVDMYAGYWAENEGANRWWVNALPPRPEEERLAEFCQWFRAGTLV